MRREERIQESESEDEGMYQVSSEFGNYRAMIG